MDLAARLRERRAEIEAAMLARVHAVADPTEVEDPEYAIGLREAVAAALEYAITALGATGQEPARVPEPLLAQARAAARNGVSLDTVLRRYSTGYSLLGDFLINEAEDCAIPRGELMRALRAEAMIFDRLIASISEAYAHEAEGRLRTATQRRAERVRMLLAGEPVEIGELRYELDAWHLAAIVSGPGAVESLRDLSAAANRNLLLVRADRGAAWVWLGGKSRLSAHELLRRAAGSLPAEVSMAIGEPGEGLEGWRLSHRQAKAAMAVVKRGPERRVLYAAVALLASALRDDVLASSLRAIYLTPLEDERDGGAVLRQTLAAYFGTGQNASSAAAVLGVSRKTVSVRLRSVGEKLGHTVDGCAAEMETALKLRVLSDTSEDAP